MADGALIEMARAERADLLEFLHTLQPHEWDEPSLCAGWQVRDVVAHMLSYEDLGPKEVARRFMRGRFSLDRVNASMLGSARRDHEYLLERLAEHLQPRGLTRAFGGMVAMLDATIHHQDIRRPLGKPRTIPQLRLRTALRLAILAPPVGALWRSRGLRLVATDVAWTFGRGREVRGPGEPLLMAIAGRHGAADELSGAGQSVLAARAGPS